MINISSYADVLGTKDLRADRQPEFTQIDIESSFTPVEDLFKDVEGMMSLIWEKALGVKLNTPFPVMSYDEAMEHYGSDKPDLRFDMRLSNISKVFSNSEFRVFKDAVNSGGVVKALLVQNAEKFSRKDIDGIRKDRKTIRVPRCCMVKDASRRDVAGEYSKNGIPAGKRSPCR